MSIQVVPPTALHSSRKVGRSAPRTHHQGFSILELLVVVAILGIVFGIAGLNLRPLANNLQNDTDLVAGIFKQARVKAVSTTSGYRIVKKSDIKLVAEYSNSCSGTAWTEDPKLSVDLKYDTRIQGNNGTIVCFSSKGLASANPTLELKNSSGKTKRIEVFLGGSIETR